MKFADKEEREIREVAELLAKLPESARLISKGFMMGVAAREEMERVKVS